MIQRIQQLRRKKGFTMVELIVAIAILGVLMAVIFANVDNTKSRIKDANSTATDFYTAVQSAFTRYMNYAGPLSPTFRDDPTTPYMKYYPGAGGNYPYDNGAGLGTPPIYNDNYPIPCTLTIEVHVKRGKVQYVNCETGVISRVLAKSDSDDGSEFGRLLKLELEKRIEYKDGYYYAKVGCSPSYTDMPPYEITDLDPVTVKYAAYSQRRLKTGPSDLTFSSRDYVLLNGNVCGVASPYHTDASSGAKFRYGESGTTL